MRVIPGDSRTVLPTLAANSVDSCVTDPPYALVSIVKRYSKGDARIENSIKLHGSQGVSPYMRAAAGFMGKAWDTGEVAMSAEFWAEVYRVLKPGAFVCAFGASRGYHRMTCAIEDAGFEVRDSLMWLYGTGFPKSHNMDGEWEGWGTALKPAFEPIVLARKPLSEGTVAANVLRWRTGALNIDGCRVEAICRDLRINDGSGNGKNDFGNKNGGRSAGTTDLGRWPANVVHDGSSEVVDAFPVTKSGTGAVKRSTGTGYQANAYGKESRSVGTPNIEYGDEGSAARFFYSAKASKADRNGSKHPTVKPIALMQWLCRLVTPPGGVVLDPFAGTGTTGAAAAAEGFDCILIEREAEYLADIQRRFAPAFPWNAP